jgi:DNA-binding PadR family transcriptional regulator
MKADPAAFLPLSPAALHILLALAGEDLHGYGIMQEVLRQSEGRYKLGPGTLYDNLQRLTAQGMVQEVARRASGDPGNDDPRRKYYRLTSSGRGVLSAEISRLETVVRDGKLRMQSAKPSRT